MSAIPEPAGHFVRAQEVLACATRQWVRAPRRVGADPYELLDRDVDPSAAPPRTARVLIVGSDPLARSGLSSLLASQAGVEVVAQSGPSEDVSLSVSRNRVDVALWDLGTDSQAAAERQGSIETWQVPVLALVLDETAAENALAAGAHGALFRDADGQILSAALQAIVLGMVVLDPALASSALRPRPRLRGPGSEPLTAREVEVLQLLSQGLSNKAVADRLGISEHTAKFHVNSILAKLGAQTRTEAVVQAVRLGLVLL